MFPINNQLFYILLIGMSDLCYKIAFSGGHFVDF